ncbi:uncharacterized protein [Nicotiana tomentosiformis]|uniref:uncharacterized protein n=1 Tax=Nicotiana tomentosiformis TaxID=4098 RepID=UPI00388CEC50
MAQPANSATGSSMPVHPSGRESQSLAGIGRGRGKANVVADALSRQSMDSGNGGVVLQNIEKSSLIVEVKEKQYEDPELVDLKERVPQQKKLLLELKGDGVLRYRGRLCVPYVAGLRDRIMSEAHYSWYSIHPGSTKMFHDTKDVYWWNDMKKNIVEYVA